MKFSKLGVLAAFAMLASVPCAALAATTGTQTFTVVVPESISIVAPNAVTITHDKSDLAQKFPVQAWVVKGNIKKGVNVAFATATPFVNTEDTSFKRDAKLELALNGKQGPASWTVEVPIDTSNYAGNKPGASVSAKSDGVGRANFDLTVSFITEDFNLFAAGDYTTTVTGTITANP
jgi:hypothetical protein